MSLNGPAKKVCVYVNEEARYRSGLLSDAVLAYLLHNGIAGATVTRGSAGFGVGREVHSTKIEVQAHSLPVKIEFIDTEKKVEEVLPGLAAMVGDGLIEVENTTVVRAPPGRERTQTSERLLRIYCGDPEPLLEKLRTLEIDGVTVTRGIAAYGAQGTTLITIVDTAEHLAPAIKAIETIAPGALLALEDLEVIRW